jgi:hypothetical protein
MGLPSFGIDGLDELRRTGNILSQIATPSDPASTCAFMTGTLRGRLQGRKTAGIHARGRGDIAIAAWIQAVEGMKRAIAAPSKAAELLHAIE